MKQTNNAIKFLMAQYRAIFKHANIAMVAAMAATAFASTASAAATNPIGTWDGIKNTAAGNPELVIEGTDKSIVIPTTQKGGSFDDVLTVKITGGADNAIEGVGAGTGDQPASVYNGKNLTINLAATGDSGSAVLGIGSTTGNIEVNVKAVNVSKGTEYVNVFFKILFLDMVPLASASIKRILIGICRFELFRLVMACDT